MKSQKSEFAQLSLGHGDAIPQPDEGCVWQLESGALCMSHVQPDGQSSLMCLALPGDVLGVERLANLEDSVEGRAITPATLTLVAIEKRDVAHVLVRAFACARQRSADMVALRTGSVPDRVRRLLLLLADGRDGRRALNTNALPSLRDMAFIVGSAHETVSRVLGRLKSLDLLQDRKAQCGTFKVQDLREHNFRPGMTSSSMIVRYRAALDGAQPVFRDGRVFSAVEPMAKSGVSQ